MGSKNNGLQFTNYFILYIPHSESVCYISSFNGKPFYSHRNMKIVATLKNSYLEHEVTVSTENNFRKVNIPGKPTGYGSLVNGGELLFLALATCFCNDVYREAAKQSMAIVSVDVTVSGEFGKEGEPATNIQYQVAIEAPAHSAEEIAAFIAHVDRVAEVHNTLRQGVSVSLKG